MLFFMLLMSNGLLKLYEVINFINFGLFYPIAKSMVRERFASYKALFFMFIEF